MLKTKPAQAAAQIELVPLTHGYHAYHQGDTQQSSHIFQDGVGAGCQSQDVGLEALKHFI